MVVALHGGDVYRHPDCIDFSANLNPLGMPKGARRALIDSVDSFAHYPDPACCALRDAIATFENLTSCSVVVTAGATDAFERIVRTLKPRRALVLSPTYAGYEEALQRAGCTVRTYPLSAEANFQVDEGILSALDGIDLAFVANPNNPTGRTVDKDLIVRILDAAEAAHARVVLDECFIDLTDKAGSTQLLEGHPNLIIVKALTKTFALAGLRLGYALTADEGLVRRLREAGCTWSVSVPAEVAGLASLTDKAYLTESRALIARMRAKLSEVLRESGLEYVPSEANFLLFHAKPGLYEQLLAHKILIRAASSFKGLDESWFRIAVRDEPDCAAFVCALPRALEELS